MLLAAKVSAGIFCRHQGANAAARGCGHFLRQHRQGPLLCKRICTPQHLSSPAIQTRAASPEAINRALCGGSDWEEPAEGFNSIPEALTDLAQGKFVVVLDDESRENEGDLIMAAETMTTEAMAFMVEYTSGVICVPLEGRDLDRLQIPLMVSSAENEEMLYTAFTVTVDARHGTTTGISASDRTATVKALADRTSQPADFKKPGHIFPLRYRQGGVLRRPGHTEAAVDLARLAGCAPVGVLCEIVSKSDGSMARTPELLEFAREHKLKCITIADLVAFRMKQEMLVQLVSSARIQTRHGSCMARCYRSLIDGNEHMALVSGNVAGKSQVLVAIHVESELDDALGVHGSQLDASIQAISSEAEGVLIYLKCEKAAPLSEQLSQLQDQNGHASVDPDPLHHGLAACMLRDIGVSSIRMLSDTDKLPNRMTGSALAVTESVSIENLQGASSSNGSNTAARSSHQDSVEASVDSWLPHK
ncbi:hypothetical protein ABBQ38_004856 [Trebouxia sp. C0009 RCD-2024]